MRLHYRRHQIKHSEPVNHDCCYLTGSMTILGLSCTQLAPPGGVLYNALKSTISIVTGVPISSVEIHPNCNRRALQLVLQFKLSVSSDSFGASAINSLSSSISSGSFGMEFSKEALKLGLTASLQASGLSVTLSESTATGVQQRCNLFTDPLRFDRQFPLLTMMQQTRCTLSHWSSTWC